MIGKLEFNLPEEQEMFQSAVDGWQWKLIVENYIHFLNKPENYLTEEEVNNFNPNVARTYLIKIIEDGDLKIF